MRAVNSGPLCTSIDEDINTIVTPTGPATIHTGPITRARARQLNYQVLSFLGNDSNVHENMMLPKLDTFVLLTNEGPSLEKDEHCQSFEMNKSFTYMCKLSCNIFMPLTS